MTYFVYLATQCEADLQLHAAARESVERLQHKIEKQQSITGLDQFLPTPFLKKSLGSMRLVIEERRLNGHHLLVFARLLFRSSNIYSKFLKNSESLRATYTASDSELSSYLAKRLEKPPVCDPAPSDAEMEYLIPDYSEPHDEIVLETQEWVERIASKERARFLSSYQELVLQFVESSSDETTLRHPHHADVAILCRRFEPQRRLVLVAPLDKSIPRDEEALRQRFGHLFGEEASLSEEQLLQRARRSYPAVILYDPAIWMDTQTTTDANIALSPEETAIVKLVREAKSQEGTGQSIAYPLFINGRPGSGKSTVLQYLFAHHVYRYLTRPSSDRLDRPPLYLTYSPQLLEHARKVVATILRCDAEKRMSLPPGEFADLQDVPSGCFANFRKFLLGRLSETDRRRFEPSLHIDFPGFRRLWMKTFTGHPNAELRRIGPELAWHVIRTYVKGMRQESGDYFDADAYSEYPSKRKSVSDETFSLVYEHVWEKWYRVISEDKGYWDDQDLARAALRTPEEDVQYPAIFCDEAQDFTKLELELILGLSLYSHRTIPPHALHLVPFAFAGDPFQTLNPTGFDWSAIQADFHENIARNLDRTGDRKLKFNFRELGFNYRSADQIVKICNAIQLLRGVAFSIKGLAPQKAWFSEHATSPAYFNIEHADVRERLRDDPEAVIVVPCHEGGEREYVVGDTFLSTIAVAEGGGLTRTVLSPMRAKGLEFSRVILYKFGEAAIGETPALIQHVIDEWKPFDLPREQTLETEYFLNRLYVAASRAQRQLIVVDTNAGVEKFWKFVTRANVSRTKAGHADSAAAMVRAACLIDPSAAERWDTTDIGRLVLGTSDQWNASSDNPLELASKLFDQGRLQRDAYFLERAQTIFTRHGDKDRADFCHAMALEFGEKFAAAGDTYARLGMADDAVRCFWRVGEYKKIVDVAASPTGTASPARIASVFMTSKRDFGMCRSFATELVSLADSDEHRVEILADERWNLCLTALIDAAGKATDGPNVPSREDSGHFLAQADRLRTRGLLVPNSIALARVAHAAGDMARVVAIWPHVRKDTRDVPPWVIEAHADGTQYPECVRYLARLKRWSAIADHYRRHVKIRLEADDVRQVFEALLVSQRHREALELVQDHGRDPGLLHRLHDASRRRSDVEIALLSADLLIDVWLDGGEGKAIVGLFASSVSKGDVPPLEENVRKQLRGGLVRKLATAVGLPNWPRDEKIAIGEFLEREVIDAANPRSMGITAREAGAAVERAGRFTDALRLYEKILGGAWGRDAAVIEFARTRWLINKQRQVQHTNEKARKQELEHRAMEWRFKPEQLSSYLRDQPEFPSVVVEEPKSTRIPERPADDGIPPSESPNLSQAVHPEPLGNDLDGLPHAHLNAPHDPPLAVSPEPKSGPQEVRSAARLSVTFKAAGGSHTLEGWVLYEKRRIKVQCGGVQVKLVAADDDSGGRLNVVTDEDDDIELRGPVLRDDGVEWRIPQWNLACRAVALKGISRVAVLFLVDDIEIIHLIL